MLTAKQEKFVLNVFRGMNQTQSYMDVYKCKSMEVAKANASRLLTKANVSQRLEDLRSQVSDAAVADVEERKRFLTKIMRTKLTDFMELGQDGSWVNLGAETPKTEAIAEIHSRTEYDKDTSQPTVYTSIKLHDPLKAVDLLNKLDGAYAPEKFAFIGKTEVEIAYTDRTKKDQDRIAPPPPATT